MELSPQAEPDLVKVYRWPQATPQYDLNHTQKMATLTQELEHCKGLALAGNYLRGINLNHCVLSGQQAANAIVL